MLQHDSTCIVRGREEGEEERPFIPPQRVENWSRKRTAMKIKVSHYIIITSSLLAINSNNCVSCVQRLSSNHRVNDLVSLSSGPNPILHARFQYGPLGMVSLAKEMVSYMLYTLSRSSRVCVCVCACVCVCVCAGGCVCAGADGQDQLLEAPGQCDD